MRFHSIKYFYNEVVFPPKLHLFQDYCAFVIIVYVRLLPCVTLYLDYAAMFFFSIPVVWPPLVSHLACYLGRSVVCVEVLRPSQQLRSCRAGQLPIDTVPGQA